MQVLGTFCLGGWYAQCVAALGATFTAVAATAVPLTPANLFRSPGLQCTSRSGSSGKPIGVIHPRL